MLVVHPPHVALITRSQVMNDKMAAKGLLVGVWVPPQEIRELRGLVARRQKMTGLATQVGKLEQENVQSDLETLRFAQAQQVRLTSLMEEMATQEEQIPRLLQIPGFGVVTAVTVWAAIGNLQRFAGAQHLVGYAGLGTKVHDGGMTRAGRRDLRLVLTEAAQVAANTHPPWKAELARLEPRLERNKAIVAIARKLLVAVWYILARHQTDRFAQPEAIAQKFLKLAYQLGKENRPAGQSAAQFVRLRLDALQLGQELTSIAWGTKKPIPLPPRPTK